MILPRPPKKNRNRPNNDPFPNDLASLLLSLNSRIMYNNAAMPGMSIVVPESEDGSYAKQVIHIKIAAHRPLLPFQQMSYSSYIWSIGMILCQPGFPAFRKMIQSPINLSKVIAPATPTLNAKPSILLSFSISPPG